MLTQARLKEVLRYDRKTGILTWFVSRGTAKAGDIAGCLKSDGYIEIKIDRSIYKAHRLAWLYMTGKFPLPETDNRNGIRDDNRFKNLREVTTTINQQNQRMARRDNPTGFLGVSRHERAFQAHIGIGGVSKHLGTFPTAELAHAAYLKAKRKLHPGCTI